MNNNVVQCHNLPHSTINCIGKYVSGIFRLNCLFTLPSVYKNLHQNGMSFSAMTTKKVSFSSIIVIDSSLGHSYFHYDKNWEETINLHESLLHRE